jgi:3-isopropylmalate dehydrogenase
MMMRYTFGDEASAARIESAVHKVLKKGLRTADIHQAGATKIGTRAMGDAVVDALST